MSLPAGVRRAPTAILSVLAVLATGLVAAAPAQAVDPTVPFIAEIHYDNSGTDTGEFVEVQVPPGSTTVGWSIALYNGSGGARYDADPLPAVTVAPGDAAGVATVSYPSNGIQNGSPDGIALLDAANGVVELLSYEGVFTASSHEALGQASTDIGVSQPGGQLNTTLSKRFDPTTGTYEWQAEATGSRDAVNPPLEGKPSPCLTEPTHEIGAVQGNGFSTPLAGQVVTVRGLVVGDLPGFGGFHLQDSDGDPATSDGVFVASGQPVSLGQTVAVTGTPEESFGQTQLAAGDAQVCEDVPVSALPAAAPLDLPADAAAREPLEGMLVDPVDALTVSEVFLLTRFGELTLSEGGLLVQPTELARPGPAAAAIAAENARRHIVLDDGSNARTSATNRPYLSPTTPVRVGDVLDFTEASVLGYGFGNWRLQPADGTADGTFAPQNTRPAAPEEVGGDLQVAAFNVLNYFLTFSGPDARGARSAAQFEKQAAKIVPAIEALGAEVVTLMEIEDTNSTGYGDGSPDQALADLVRRLNLAAGDNKWSYSPLPDELLLVDRDVIRNGIIYQHDVVQPVGDPVGLVDESVWFNAREPIAQTFTGGGDLFIVVANHFKSKSPGSPTGDNVDSGDGQGQWNGDRRRQAASLAEFTDRLRADTGDQDVLIMGDLNAYTREDPIEDLRQAGFTDLGSELDPGRYSYVFDAHSGSLDHAMATDPLTRKITDVAHWNINAVESFAYQYTGDLALYAPNQYRSSDHDPLVLGIDLGRCLFTDDPVNKVRTLDGDCSTSTTVGVPDGWTLNGADYTITAFDAEGDHFRGAVVANEGAVANVRNLTVRAYDLADVCDAGDDRLRGIMLDGASGSVSDNRVLGIDQGASGCQEGTGIEVRNAPFDNTGVDTVVTVSGNEVRDYQKGGIVANGSVNVTILGNTVQGVGPVDYIAQNGVQLAFGATGVVESNSIADNFYTGADVACGLLFFEADGVKQKRNTFAGNERDVCNVGRGGGKASASS